MAENKLDLLKKLTRLANNNPNEHEANLAARKACKLLEELNWQMPVVVNTRTGNVRPQQPPPRPSPPPSSTGRSYGGSRGGGYGFEDFFRGTPFEQEARRQKEAAQKEREENYKRAQEAEKERIKKAHEEAERRTREWEEQEREFQRQRSSTSRPFTSKDPNWDSYFYDRDMSGRTWTFDPTKDTAWIHDKVRKKFVNVQTGQEISEIEFYMNYARHADTKPPEPPKEKKDEERELTCSRCGKKQKTRFMGHPSVFLCFSCW